MGFNLNHLWHLSQSLNPLINNNSCVTDWISAILGLRVHYWNVPTGPWLFEFKSLILLQWSLCFVNFFYFHVLILNLTWHKILLNKILKNRFLFMKDMVFAFRLTFSAMTKMNSHSIWRFWVAILINVLFKVERTCKNDLEKNPS